MLTSVPATHDCMTETLHALEYNIHCAGPLPLAERLLHTL